MSCDSHVSYYPYTVMEIDAIGTYTVSKIVYDLWMKVTSTRLCSNTIPVLPTAGKWREHYQHISYPPLYWNCLAGEMGGASYCKFIILVIL